MTWSVAANRYDGMTCRRCGRSGLKLPAISLGLWYNFGGTSAFENGRAMVRWAFDFGVMNFDLANNQGPPPGSAEEAFGRILRDDLRRHRNELIVATKAGYLMWPRPYGECGLRKYLLASLDQSLRRLDLDYVNIFYSHRFDPETPLEETMSALDRAVRSGKALYVGISSYSAEKTAEAAAIFRGGNCRQRILAHDGSALTPPNKPRPDCVLVKALVWAWRQQRQLDTGVYSSVTQIAAAEKVSESYVSRILRLALLAPDLVAAILGGWADQRVILEKLERPRPVRWAAQHTLLLAR